MSAITIEYPVDQTTLTTYDRRAVDTAPRERPALLRRPFTTVYRPRHRADGPAL